jgi:predicted membrane GTPase involved in stress response
MVVYCALVQSVLIETMRREGYELQIGQPGYYQRN